MYNTKDWDLYENGKKYNRKLEPTFYDLVDTNWDFFYGRQWRNAGLNKDLPQPVFNNINRFVTFFVASILSNAVGVNYDSPIKGEEGDISDDIVNQSWAEFAEEQKFDFNLKNALYDGAVTGDYVFHFRFDADCMPYDGAFSNVVGKVKLDRIDPNNFYVANPNIDDVQSQDYVQIYGRDTIKNLKEESKNVSDLIKGDTDYEEQASYYGRIEMDTGNETDKAGYVITYRKKMIEEEIPLAYKNAGYEQSETSEDIQEKKEKKLKKRKVSRVYASKCIQEHYIYENVDLGINLYPVAKGSWELQRNTYHGMSFVTAQIPAQIFINRGFAMAMYNVMTTAFPKLLYDKTSIGGFSNQVGGQYGIELRSGETLANKAAFLSPGNMSAQVVQMIELAQQYMKDTAGAQDALLGNINPEQASGVSISVASKQAGVPLENPKTNMYNFVEDCARIYLDMITNLYGVRPVIMPGEDGNELVEFDFSTLKGMFKSVSIDVGPTSYWSEIAVIQTLDNLLDRGLIEFIDYLERMPEGYIADKQGLIDDLKEKLEAQQDRSMTSDEELLQAFMSQLTPEEQQAFMQLPQEQQEQYLLEFQGGAA